MSAPEVTVIDYGLGNLLSVQRAFEHCGAKVIVTSDSHKILNSERVVLPGVGAFSNAISALKDLGLVTVIQELDRRKTPLLGICLGMQLLLDQSDEFGVTAGLGLIPGRVVAVPNYSSDGGIIKIPHIGWSSLYPSDSQVKWEKTLLSDCHPGEAVYFVHSFMAVPTNIHHCIADCLYGEHKIASVIKRDHITACQFHPEKSGEVGLRIIRRFCVD
jgi:glutamine amidotransferase